MDAITLAGRSLLGYAEYMLGAQVRTVLPTFFTFTDTGFRMAFRKKNFGMSFLACKSCKKL